MKKLWILLCMIVSLLCVNKQVYAASANPNLTVSTVSAEPGSTVEVPISIANNTGICGAALSVSYDEKLVLTGVSAGEAFSSMAFTKPGDLSANPVKLLWDNVDVDKTNGTIAILTFQVPKEAGTYKVSVSCEADDVIDSDLNSVTLNIANGGIQVAEKSNVI